MSCATPNAVHWEDLRARPSEDVLRNPGVWVSSRVEGYTLNFLNAVYDVDTTSERIMEISPQPSMQLTEEFQILLIRYLVAKNGGPLEGKEISEKDFPGGVTFFQGPHALYTEPVARLFGDDPQAFEDRGCELGAKKVPYGDRAMRFLPFELIPVTYVLWKKDAEFPASISVLFDKSISRWFELDMIFTLVLVLTVRIVDGRE